jgi:hypothetical protein
MPLTRSGGVTNTAFYVNIEKVAVGAISGDSQVRKIVASPKGMLRIS